MARQHNSSTQDPETKTTQAPRSKDESPEPRHPFPVVGIGASAGGLDAFKGFFAAMPADSGMAFVQMLLRRVRRRMVLCHVQRLSEYLGRLRTDADEAGLLFKDFLISVTSFFREPHAFKILQQRVIDPLVERKGKHAPVRVWVPGCATGEEAYSIAILLIESISRLQLPCTIQVFATDIDEDALEFARQGIYPESIATDLTPERLTRFFLNIGDHHYQVNKQLRETVVFAAQNLIGDAPFSRLDLISCRNLLIYLEPDVQRKIVALFHFALHPGGFLFLGPSETVGRQVDLFETVSKKWRVFRRIGPTRRDRVEFPIVAGSGEQGGARPLSIEQGPSAHLDFSRLAQRLLLETYAPASLLINRRYEILYFHGPTIRYLELPTGEPTRDLIAMARPGLRTKLRAACHRAVRENRLIRVDTARVKRDNGHYPVTMTITPVTEPKSAEGLLLVTFADLQKVVTELEAPGGGESLGDEAPAMQQLEYELKTTREDLQSTIEEMESSNEELKASNEEVMSMNEELQSANEELETSKEELQSLNEELSTVNNQLQDKVEELERTSNDITNLLDSTDIATIFLDTGLRIKRFTPATSQLLPLLTADIGRPFDDFSLKLNDDTLLTDAKRVLEDLAPLEKEVSTQEGRHYLRRIRPYRTQDKRIEGVVLTFVDITARVEAAAESRRLAAVLLDSNDALTVIDLDGRINAWNRGAARIYGYTEAEALGMDIKELFPGEEREQFAAIMQRIVNAEPIDAYESRRLTKDGRTLDVWVTLTTLVGEDGKLVSIATTERDITLRKQTEAQLKVLNRELEQRIDIRTAELQRREQDFRMLADNVPACFSYIDAGQRYKYVNRRYVELFAQPAPDMIGKTVEEVLGPRFYQLVLPHIEQALSGHEERFEVEIELSDGVHIFQAVYRPDSGENGSIRGFFTLANDVTDKKLAERALLEKGQRLNAIVNTVVDAIITVDRQGIVHDFNHAAEGIFGYSAQEAIGANVQRLFAQNIVGAEGAFLSQYRAWTESNGDDIRRELVGCRKDGARFPLEFSVAEIDHLGLYVCCLQDISTRKSLEREVIEISALEQEHIGREIHDGIGQQLTALGMLATSLERKLTRIHRPQEARAASELVGHIQKALADAKGLSRGLSPVEIGPEGLVDALSVLMERVQASSGIRCRLSVPGPTGALDEFAAVHLYRIAQEALNNAVKHAQADNIELELCSTDQGIVLSVCDNGSGIGPMRNKNTGLGQHIMRYRAGIIGGSLEIGRGRSGGTEVKCTMPRESSDEILQPGNGC